MWRKSERIHLRGVWTKMKRQSLSRDTGVVLPCDELGWEWRSGSATPPSFSLQMVEPCIWDQGWWLHPTCVLVHIQLLSGVSPLCVHGDALYVPSPPPSFLWKRRRCRGLSAASGPVLASRAHRRPLLNNNNSLFDCQQVWNMTLKGPLVFSFSCFPHQQEAAGSHVPTRVWDVGHACCLQPDTF